MKEALRTLFRSDRSWQRRLACQIGFRTLTASDLPVVKTLLALEENAECRAWLNLISAKLGGHDEIAAVQAGAAANRDAYLEVLRKLWKCEDLPELHVKLKAQTAAQTLTVEAKLALILA